MSQPQQDAEAIVKRIVASRHPAVTPEDAAVLAKAPKRTLMMEKLLAVHFNQISDFTNALKHAEIAFQQERTSENAKNIALLYRKTKQTGTGIQFCKDHKDLINGIEFNDILSMLHWDAGQNEEAAKYGTQSLGIKDQASPKAEKLTPQIRPFNGETPKRNVISFSLFGRDPRYISGAQNNILVARYLYPGWAVRVYVDASVPDNVQGALSRMGAQVVTAPADMPAAQYGLFWRFLVEDDPDVDIYLVRDADSVMNIKERAAVEDWLSSGKAFHLMRDLPIHSELILAGMWGAHRGNLPDMRSRIMGHVTSGKKKINNKITDQEFLRTKIWPIVRQDVLAHDQWFDFGNPVRFRDEFLLPRAYHIGQNDWVHQRGAKAKG